MSEKRSKKQIIILWTLVVVWGIIAVFLSRQKGMATAELSYGISERIRRTLDMIGITAAAEDINFLIRKLAHILIYFIFGVIIYKTLRYTIHKPSGWIVVLCSVIVCTAVSALDEVQKLFISGRHCDPGEIILNGIAAAAGILTVYLVNKKHKRNDGDVE